MNAAVFPMVLLGAGLHATWNVVVKSGGDRLLTTIIVTGSAALIALVTLPFLTPPASQSWPFIAASTVLQIAYFILVARIYHVADMSETYPIMRGMAPILVAMASLFALKEPLAPLAWIGIAIICAGILTMASGRGTGVRTGTGLALLNAAVIAGYTLIDGAGVRRSGAPAAYTLWIFLLTGGPFILWALAVRARVFRSYIMANWRIGIVGGFGAITSYGLALWAMTVAPVAMVSALRETSILFGVLLSAIFLKERISRARAAAVCVIAVGAVFLRLA